ncbi:MAG: adenosylcobinamide amidohydrolase [Deltaproteobacteria bacterium]|jgi:adenosylcobinamide amidohydrolase|nr:adenosylcobinamide amidohydrolase [Deltaproteobacteria bacterium]
MLLGRFYDALELHREEKIIYGLFLRPHLVVSTSRAGGGQRGDLKYLANHQGCEPAAHSHNVSAAMEPVSYQSTVCARYGLDPESCALLGTAANMRLCSVKSETFRGLTVVAAVTGGVESNAGRAGDRAYIWEGPLGYESLPKEGDELQSEEGEAHISPNDPSKQGTINTLLFIGQPLTPGALVRTIMTATEAKTAVLQQLAVNSRYSDGLATGTGTDQIGVASLIDNNLRPITGAGKHSKLGELIALVVMAALKEVLIRQNGMTLDRQCSIKIHIERFAKTSPGRYGLKTEELLSLIAKYLDKEQEALMRANYRALFHDPLHVSQVAAMAHLKDKFAWGILPASLYGEVMSLQASNLAVAVSGHPDYFKRYYALFSDPAPENSNINFLNLAARALALGFGDKWL